MAEPDGADEHRRQPSPLSFSLSPPTTERYGSVQIAVRFSVSSELPSSVSLSPLSPVSDPLLYLLLFPSLHQVGSFVVVRRISCFSFGGGICGFVLHAVDSHCILLFFLGGCLVGGDLWCFPILLGVFWVLELWFWGFV